MRGMPDCIHDIAEEWCADCNPKYAPGTTRDWREVLADDVTTRIPVSPEPGISRDNLAAATGLSISQLYQVTSYIRENYPALGLVSDRNGLRFTADAADVDRYRHARLKASATIARRTVRGAVIPLLRQAGVTDIQQRRVEMDLQRLVEDIEMLESLAL